MKNLILLCFIILWSCSKTTFVGETRSLLRTQKDVVLFDYSELDLPESIERFQFMPGDHLNMTHLFCINHDPSELSRDCVSNCCSQLNADIFVVCYDPRLRQGQHVSYRHDAQVRSQDSAIVKPSQETMHAASLSFDIYDIAKSLKVASFGISVKFSGVAVKNRRDLGYSTVNLRNGQSALHMCRKKGIKNISKRLID